MGFGNYAWRRGFTTYLIVEERWKLVNPLNDRPSIHLMKGENALLVRTHRPLLTFATCMESPGIFGATGYVKRKNPYDSCRVRFGGIASEVPFHWPLPDIIKVVGKQQEKKPTFEAPHS